MSGPVLDAQLIAGVVEALAADPIVRANGRWRRARFALAEVGAGEHAFVVDRGAVRAADRAGDAELPEVRISGTGAQWRAIVEGRHGGLHRAWRYRLLDFAGDSVATFDLWKTVWRLGDALAAAGRERAGAV